MRSINLIVIHCSASPNGVFVTPEQIDAWHAARGFHRDAQFADKFRPQLKAIGYHRIVLADGNVRSGREFDEIGAHAAGHNANSIGICMVGTDGFFLAQWKGLRQLLGGIALGLANEAKVRVPATCLPTPSPSDTMKLLANCGVRVVGHRDLSPDLNGDGVIERNEWVKLCPGFDVKSWLDHGMEPVLGAVLDDHPAVSDPSAKSRVLCTRSWPA